MIPITTVRGPSSSNVSDENSKAILKSCMKYVTQMGDNSIVAHSCPKSADDNSKAVQNTGPYAPGEYSKPSHNSQPPSDYS